ncbi:hypothetical protein ACROYT_G020102 [Oculina patagonica]
MPFFRFCFKLIFQVLAFTVKWLVQSILYISNLEILRAEGHEPVQREDQEESYPVQCTEPGNNVYMHGLLAERRFPVQCTEHD